MNYQSESIKKLYDVVSKLGSAEECRMFFEDICTIKEIQDMAQRLDTAVMLDEGMSYSAIEEKLRISTATISRVSRCLNYGSGGYRLVLDKLNSVEKSENDN